MAYTDSCCN